jgi:phosphate transport system permease protein
MSVPPTGVSPLSSLTTRSVRRRKTADVAVKALSWVAASIGIAAMALILYMVVRRGWTAMSDLGFFHKLPPSPGGTGGGLGNAIVGTLMITSGAALMGIPLGFFAGIYLAEFGRDGRIATAIRLVANVMMGVPSIIVGVFAFGLLVLTTHHYSGFAGACALAFIMLPVMARTAEDILNLVPNELRESALALGAPRWKATLGVICRAARNGLVTGAILSVVRVGGETAPLLFTAFNSPYWPHVTGGDGFFGGPTANLTKTIFDFATSPYGNWINLAWAGALLIIIAVLGMNIAVRLVFQRGKEW